ncbi:MAG: hypothetical protein EOP62_06315 [Sphingomonadales bacterium]|nr:MAG: hypothetical protein EOP62_06315 [Sphingomonadales bacterium]
MSRPSNRLGRRAPAVFERYLHGESRELHPEDRSEAEAFWSWLDKFERPEEASGYRTPSRWPVLAGGLIAVALVVVSLWGLGARPFAPPSEPFVTYASGHGENRSITLSDGSRLDLAAETRVDVAYTAAERRLVLRSGEALFTVAHNARRPFIVSAANGEVRAIGTAFDIRASARTAEVTIIDGTVEVAANDENTRQPAKEAIVRKGNRVRFGLRTDGGRSAAYLTQPEAVDPGDAIAWKRGLLIFRGERLENVIPIVNRYADRPVTLTAPDAAGTPIFGVFKTGEVEEIRAIAQGGGLSRKTP